MKLDYLRFDADGTDIIICPSGMHIDFKNEDDPDDRAAVVWGKTDMEKLAQFFEDCAKLLRKK